MKLLRDNCMVYYWEIIVWSTIRLKNWLTRGAEKETEEDQNTKHRGRQMMSWSYLIHSAARLLTHNFSAHLSLSNEQDRWELRSVVYDADDGAFSKHWLKNVDRDLTTLN